MKKRGLYVIGIISALCASVVLGSCTLTDRNLKMTSEQKDATDYTAKLNSSVFDNLNFSDEQEIEFAQRGLIEAPQALEIFDDSGNLVWSMKDYDFVKESAPDSANPSLWRNTQLNAYAGLFEVCDGIYQIRGYDMANVTYIRTESGWIVFDVLMCKEDMEQANALIEKHFGKLPVKAVIYSHPHVDHYGGVEGIISKEDTADSSLPLDQQVASGKTAVIAPEGFLTHAVSENIYAGKAMSRRAQYQYGTLINPGSKGSLSIGIGMGQSNGTVSLIAPSYEVSESMQKVNIDGIEIVFQLTPHTEAPAEMNAWFPQKKALWVAENCTGTMHNLYTLRGAEIRDGNAWANYICEAAAEFGNEAEVVFQSHNWPHWGNDVIKKYMEDTASVYKYIHDQTLHYINQGYTSAEISNMISLPESLNKVWYTRQYYGTLSHNIKAVYQKYMGWYDANPVNLNPLEPSESAKKLVEYLGDTDKVLELAAKDFEKGEYQWVAQITNQIVYAEPGNKKARMLCADALEQLGYQAESGTWRNCYLTAALELREGNQSANAVKAKQSNVMRELDVDMLLDYIGINTDAKLAENDNLSLNLNIIDNGKKYFVKRKDGVLLYYKDYADDSAEATVSCTRLQLIEAVTGTGTDGIQIEGSADCLERLVKYMDTGNNVFNIVEP